jgi:sugar phosphate isomerase/epimerase
VQAAAERIWAGVNGRARLTPSTRRWSLAAFLLVAVLTSGLSPMAALAGSPLSAATDSIGRAAANPATAPVPAYVAKLPGGPIPFGKGMWLNNVDQALGGDPAAIVAAAKAAGLTHIYLRLGSSKKGFYAQPTLDRLLPVAHKAGLKVVGWDFPYLFDPAGDAERARQEIWYRTAHGGHRIDAFAADIETGAEGTNLTGPGAALYGTLLRQAAGLGYPLIATVPRPSAKRWFPYAEAVADFDAIAPMVYWGQRDPVSDVQGAIASLAQYRKPVIPVGQAYDSAIDGWAGGVPSKQAIERFIDAAASAGAVGVSFWVWDKASADHWAAITEATQVTLDAAAVARSDQRSVAQLQRVLSALGHPTFVDGVPGPATSAALTAFQLRVGVPSTGQLDGLTLAAIEARPSP